MRVYDISCEHCGWKAPLPVDAEVAEKMRRKDCRDCLKAERGTFPFTVKERIVVGPVQFFPSRRKEVKQ